MKIIFLGFFFTLTTFSQTKGIVKDSLSGLPIPYVNIWIESENGGTNTELDGAFYLRTKSSKRIVFSALGYETKIMDNKEILEVLMRPKTYVLSEVVLEKPKNRRHQKIGKAKHKKHRLYLSNTSQVYGQVFDVSKKREKTPYLSKIEIFTHSHIEGARFRVVVMDLGKNGIPDNHLTPKEIIVFVKKGYRKNIIDLKEQGIYLTDDNVFVGFQSLIVEENKFEYYLTQEEKLKPKSHRHEPSLIINSSDDGRVYHQFQVGTWHQVKKTGQSGYLGQIHAPAINIMLSD